VQLDTKFDDYSFKFSRWKEVNGDPKPKKELFVGLRSLKVIGNVTV